MDRDKKLTILGLIGWVLAVAVYIFVISQASCVPAYAGEMPSDIPYRMDSLENSIQAMSDITADIQTKVDEQSELLDAVGADIETIQETAMELVVAVKPLVTLVFGILAALIIKGIWHLVGIAFGYA